MTQSNQSNFVHTNVRVFYKIAQESYAAMNEFLEMYRRPKPNGESGYINTLDPDKKSFKNALITIVFCGVCLESVLHLLIVNRKSVDVFKEFDRKGYEDKLQLLGCNDTSIMELCKNFKAARREVVHEKAHLDHESIRAAQIEAAKAIDLVDKVFAYFKLEMG